MSQIATNIIYIYIYIVNSFMLRYNVSYQALGVIRNEYTMTDIFPVIIIGTELPQFFKVCGNIGM